MFEIEPDLPDFDKLWDYDDPEGTENKFHDLLPKAERAGATAYLIELLTQIARAKGMRGKFEAAHKTLDVSNALLLPDYKKAKIRYLLERGRLFNSAKNPDQARPLFLQAWDEGNAAKEDYYAIDAAHMMGIIEPPDEQIEWNLKALELTEKTSDQRAKTWLGSLYNNIGWSYHASGQYDKALEIFEKSLEWRQNSEQDKETRIAKWSVARTLRSLGRIKEALEIQEALLEEYAKMGAGDGFVFEELGECLLLLDRTDEAQIHFAKAYELLCQDPWFVDNEAKRLERLKKIGGLESKTK